MASTGINKKCSYILTSYVQEDLSNYSGIRETAATVNFQLTKLVVSEHSTPSPRAEPEGAAGGEGAGGQGEEGKLNLDAVVGVLTQMLHHSSVHTKVAALDWILHLYNKLPNEVSE